MTPLPAPVRRVAAAVLILQALVILLAMRPVQLFSEASSSTVLLTLGGVAIICVLLCGVLRFRAGWYMALATPVLLLVAGVMLHWSLAVVAMLFGAVWWYIAHVAHVLHARPTALQEET